MVAIADLSPETPDELSVRGPSRARGLRSGYSPRNGAIPSAPLPYQPTDFALLRAVLRRIGWRAMTGGPGSTTSSSPSPARRGNIAPASRHSKKRIAITASYCGAYSLRLFVRIAIQE